MKPMKKAPEKSVTALVPRETAKELKRYCKSAGLVQKNVIGLAIRKWLDGQDPQPAKEK